MNNAFFILGTDTGVGKTVVSLLCMQSLLEQGFAPAYVKPFQTGCPRADDETSDERFVREHLPAGRANNPLCTTLSCFGAPKAPYFAARDEKKEVDLNDIHRQLRKISSGPWTHLIMEGAGGTLVPITADRLLVDIVRSLEIKAHIVLVARAGLGTINHTLLSVEALARRDLRPKAIVLIDNDGSETPQDMVMENIEAIEAFSGIRPAGVIGKIRDFFAAGNAIHEVIERILMSSPDQRGTAEDFAERRPALFNLHHCDKSQQ